MNADLDIVIPCFNYADRVTRAVNSALACADVRQVIVVNDGSTDDSAEVLDQLAMQQPGRMSVIHQANAGPSAARNAGIRTARATWVLLLDADDELVGEGVSQALARLRAQPQADVMLTSAEAVHEGRAPRLRAAPDDLGGNLFRRFLDGEVPVSHGRFIARRELLLRIPYPETIRGQEDLPVYALMLALGSVVSCPAVTVRIHHHAASLRRNTAHMVANEEAVVAAIFDHPDLPAEDRKRRQQFHARRLFSIFRALAKRNDPQAGTYFWRGFRLAPFSRRWWRQLPRYLRWRFAGTVKES